MKRLLEKSVSIGIGVFILLVLSLVFTAFFGSSLLGLITLVAGFPLAFPVTTTFLVAILAVVVLFKKRK